MRRAVLAVALTLVQPGPAWAGVGAPPGSIGIRLLEAPSHLRDDPRARVYIIDHLAQGETIHRRIEVSSGLDHAERLSLYAAGAAIGGGRFRFFPRRSQDELSTWITVVPHHVLLLPHGHATAEMTIAVPADAVDGERYAVIWAESPPSPARDGDVAAINRVGIRVYLSVGHGAVPPTDFRIDSLTALRDDDGHPVVLATVSNTGWRAVDLTGRLDLTDGPGGISAGPYPIQPGRTIGIGQRAGVRFLLDSNVPDGPWKADVTLESGLISRSASALIEFPSSLGARSVAVPATVTRPWWWLAWMAVAGAVAGAASVLVVARRRRRRPRGKHRIGAPTSRPVDARWSASPVQASTRRRRVEGRRSTSPSS